MTLSFQLSENDFLQHQLFVAAQSPSIKKSRKASLITCTIGFLILGLIFYLNEEHFLSIGFLVFAVITLLFFPAFQAKQLTKAYRHSINENYKNRFGKSVQATFTDDSILYNGSGSESKIALTSIGKVNELQDLFIVEITTGGGILIPKQQLENVASVRQLLQDVSRKLSVPFVQELNWKWK
jgi:hypothetical protein